MVKRKLFLATMKQMNLHFPYQPHDGRYIAKLSQLQYTWFLDNKRQNTCMRPVSTVYYRLFTTDVGHTVPLCNEVNRRVVCQNTVGGAGIKLNDANYSASSMDKLRLYILPSYCAWVSVRDIIKECSCINMK